MTGEQRIVLFSGTVQGVGFRYTACRVAGGVECIVEGDPAEIDAFLASLAQQMGRYIRKQTQQMAPYTGKYASFAVVY